MKNFDFITIFDQIIWIKKIGICSILLIDDIMIEFYNIALTSKYDSNFILFNQLYNSRITYPDNLIIIILIWKENVIVYIQKKKKFFLCLIFVYLFKICQLELL